MSDVWDQGPYANETYLRSLATSSGDIKRQVGNTLQEIARQRAVAGQQTEQIPGAAGLEFDRSQNQLSGDMQTLGIGPLASVMNAFSNGKASYGRASGLLNQGFGEQEVSRRGSANNIQQELLSDLASKANTYISGRQLEDRDKNFRTQEAERQAAVQRQMQDQAHQQAMSLIAAARAQAAASAASYLPPPSAPQYTGSTGGSRAPGSGAILGPLASRSFDEGYYAATAAYGDAGALDFLSRNQREGGLTQGQREVLSALQRRQAMLSQRLQ